MHDQQGRSELLRQALRWCYLSVGWAAVAGATSLVVGLTAGSIARIGLGAN